MRVVVLLKSDIVVLFYDLSFVLYVEQIFSSHFIGQFSLNFFHDFFYTMSQ